MSTAIPDGTYNAPIIGRTELLRAKHELLTAETQGHLLRNQIYAEEVNDRILNMAADGIYNFYSPVLNMTVTKAMYELDAISRRRPGGPVTIVFNSPGGVVTDGFTLYDFIRDLARRGHHVTTKCMGTTASMGAILMQAGDLRVMTPNAFMMVHEISGGTEGSLAEMKDTLAIVEKFQGKALDILTSRSRMTRRTLAQKWKKTDWYMDAAEALKHGFIDTIEE